ncbi:Type 1 glutamine amidotransferase-like domain-containing protein [Bacillus sp. RAR_GA_16]|uniref:Type 1 glutamine amidotransferase-like domain-containing protein n=1 Tax=Bacillus sp. RAR_GA_16 TaxID=2876774 RepID=UPI001CC90171|nr:Type 1 glutamine amidotransferase-like domain-containing protein [Bacillus sp. RAR_GA_16]MCA0174113.1 Type 1 glutamine amidotransferase-like domain-containing protein [Bacillus sp. RAR_GA_16]
MKNNGIGKLFFYSDQVVESPGNQRLDALLFEGLEISTVQVGYIPSTEDKRKQYFQTKVQYYQDYGVTNFLYFDLYSEFNSLKIKDLLQCDMIHLSAGNPVDFGNAMTHRGMDKILVEYVQNGGIIVGVSGGGVLLGESVNLFQLFIDDDKQSSETLQFVDFEFLPHYNRWNEDFKQKVREYSERKRKKIVCVNDGDGLMVDGDSIRMIGNVQVIGGS